MKIVAALIPFALSFAFGATKASSPDTARVRAQFSRLPLAFEPNQGQVRSDYDFLARGQNYDLLLSRLGL